MSREI
jgi:hypothetical protein